MKLLQGIIKFALIIIFTNSFYNSHAQDNLKYQQAYFSDTNRIKKIKTATPVIEKLYKEYALKNHFPAVAFGIVADGKLIYASYSGYANVANKKTANNKSVFRIASMTKSFTAVAILKLRDAGKLRLDDSASQYIPQMKQLKYLTTDAAPITIRNLLSHSAGFPEDNPWGDRQLATTDDELLKLVEKGISFSNNPGIGYEYSNLAFALLGQIISKVSGKPYQQYITENILQPLNMNDTYWEYSKVPANELVHGYRWINDGWAEEPLLHDGAYGAMGGLLTTIEDFSKYMAFQMAAWPQRDNDDNSILKHSSLREMQQPSTFNTLNTSYRFLSGKVCPSASAYGFGLRWMRDCNNRTFVGHAGGLPGFGSHWTILPEYGIGVMCFANVTYAPATPIDMQVLDTLISLAHLKPLQLPASAILEQRKAELVKLLPDWSSAESKKIFAVNFFPDYPYKTLRKNTQELFAASGKILKVSEVFPENNLRGYFIMEGEKANIKVSFTLTPENPALIQSYEAVQIVRD